MKLGFLGLVFLALGVLGYTLYVSRIRFLTAELVSETFRRSFVAITLLTLIASVGLSVTISSFDIDGQTYAALLTNLLTIPVAFSGAMVVIVLAVSQHALAKNQAELSEKQHDLERSQFLIEARKDFQLAKSISVNLSNKALAAREAFSDHIWLVSSRARVLFNPNDDLEHTSSSIFSSESDDAVERFLSGAQEEGLLNDQVVFLSRFSAARVKEIIESEKNLEACLTDLMAALQEFSSNSLCSRAVFSSQRTKIRQDLTQEIRACLERRGVEWGGAAQDNFSIFNAFDFPKFDDLILELASITAKIRDRLKRCEDDAARESYVQRAYFSNWRRVKNLIDLVGPVEIAQRYLTSHGLLAFPSDLIREIELGGGEEGQDDELVLDGAIYFIFNRVSAVMYSCEILIPAGVHFATVLDQDYCGPESDARDFDITIRHNDLVARYFDVDQSLVIGDENRFFAYTGI